MTVPVYQRWLGLSEQFFRFDKWNPCHGDENDGPAKRDRLNSFVTWTPNRPESFQILSCRSGLCLLLLLWACGQCFRVVQALRMAKRHVHDLRAASFVDPAPQCRSASYAAATCGGRLK